MSATDPPERLTPAEQALERHLELLRTDAPVVPATLGQQIIRSARWQRAIRRPLLVVARFAQAAGDAIRLLLAPRSQR